MALPTTREEFKSLCLRNIGDTVLDINISEEQIEDQINIALQYFNEFHFDGTQKIYYKLPITANVRSDAIHHLTLVTGGTGYQNTDTVVITSPPIGNVAIANIVTYSNGTIQTVNLIDNGQNYSLIPTVTITSNTGSNASITAHLGGYFEIPENIIGISRVFPFHFFTTSNDMFSLEYQMAINNMYSIINSQLVPFYMSKMHLQLFQEVLVGRTSFRFNKNVNKLYIDVLNQRLKVGEFMVIEAYSVLDPETYTDIWKDRFLIRYCTALLKKVQGTNLKKFTGVMLPGGVAFSGQQMYEEAVEEIKELEMEMNSTWSVPVVDMIAGIVPFICLLFLF